ncbi:MAG: RHS repeat protein, partial [Candidatus Omnitrophica bacterium]|nr:RHS repeat protein [Candidatus Omnitrophota bacterium]
MTNYYLKKITALLILFFFAFSCFFPPNLWATHIQPPWYQGATEQVGGNVAVSGNQPFIEEKSPPPFINGCTMGGPVNLATGEETWQCEDISLPGRGLGIEIYHEYRSGKNFNGPFGYGWGINYYYRLKPLDNGNMLLVSGNLRRDEYTLNNGQYIPPPGFFEDLVQNQDGTWALTKAHGEKYNFDLDGKLASIIDRNGNRLDFSYDPSGLLPIIGTSEYIRGGLQRIVISLDYRLTGISDGQGRSVSLSYDSNGRLETITDNNNRVVRYGYDANTDDLLTITRPATAQFPSGVTETFTYANHNLLTITDAKGQTFVTNRYDSQERVFEQALGSGTYRFNYGTNQATVTDRKGFVTRYNFNSSGNPTRIEEFTQGLRPGDPASYITQYAYNADMLKTAQTYPKGNGIKYVYDEANPNRRARGNLLQLRRKSNMAASDNDQNDIVTNFTYEANFNFIKTVTDPKGSQTTYTYDYELPVEDPDYGDNGNLVKITLPQAGGETPEVRFSYNQNGQVINVTDPAGNQTAYEYYADTGYLYKVRRDPGSVNSTVEFTYDAYGNIASIKDPNGHIASFTHNALNWLINETDALGYMAKYTYDANGNIIKLERQANSQATIWQATQFTYNNLNKVLTVTDPLSRVTTFSYDNNENRRTVLDAEGNTTTYDYDERDLLWKETDANTPAGVTEYWYDQNRNLAKIKDANNNETLYAFDLFDRETRQTYADNSYEETVYDKNSNLTGIKTPASDPGVYNIALDYDALNRLTAKSYPLNPINNVTYAYDIASRLTDVNNSSAQINYSYDSLNRISNSTTTISQIPPQRSGGPRAAANGENARSEGNGDFLISYQYDASGNPTQTTYPSGKAVNYQYDELDRMKEVAGVAAYSYDILSRRIKMSYANNTAVDYSYNMADELLQLSNYKKQGSNDAVKQRGNEAMRQRSKDVRHSEAKRSEAEESLIEIPASAGMTKKEKAGPRNVISASSSVIPANAGISNFWSFIGSLFAVKPAEAITQIAVPEGTFSYYNYTYDRAGNRTLLRSSRGNHAYGYDDIYQLTSDQRPTATDSFVYDKLGNRDSWTRDSNTIPYVPNNLNQYTSVNGINYAYDGNGNLTSDGANTYTYDEENRLTSVIVSGSEAIYSYDGLGRRISKTFDGVTTYFIYDRDRVIEDRDTSGALIRDYVYGSGIDEVLVSKSYIPNPISYYYFYDGLGSVTEITNEIGEVAEYYEYDAYGTPVILS